MIKMESERFGLTPEILTSFMLRGNEMEFDNAISIISKFDAEQKKYVCAYLATIMASDGDIDENEMKLWRLVSLLCGFPQMGVREAVTYITNKY